MTLALQRRRRVRIALVVAVSIAAATAGWSHLAAPRDGHDLSGQLAAVVRVIDGDTVAVLQNGVEDHCHLLGIDAPDLARDGSAATLYADAARTCLTRRLEGKTVTLKIDEPETRDRQGDLLAYVYLNDSECVNVTAVRDGAAYADRRVRCSMRSPIEQAEAQARLKKSGLWDTISLKEMPPWRQIWLAQRKIKQ